MSRTTSQQREVAWLRDRLLRFRNNPAASADEEARLILRMLRPQGREQVVESSDPEPIHIGDLKLEPGARRVFRSGSIVPVTDTEFRLLLVLVRNPNRIWSREELLKAVWGNSLFVTPRNIDVQVRRLRAKI